MAGRRQAPPQLPLPAPAASRRRRPGAASSRRPSGSSTRRATRRRRWRRSRPRPGCALKTVYVVFTTKSGLLRALWDLLLKGDQADAGVAERPWYRQVLDEPDPVRQLRSTRATRASVKERIAGVLKVIRRRRADRPGRRRALAAHPVGLLRQPARHRRGAARKGALRPGSTSPAPPTCCGRSTTPTSGCCWSASAGGRPRSGSAGSPTPPATSSWQPSPSSRPRAQRPHGLTVDRPAPRVGRSPEPGGPHTPRYHAGHGSRCAGAGSGRP